MAPSPRHENASTHRRASLRLSPELVARVTQYRHDARIESKADTIRHLITAGLGAEAEGQARSAEPRALVEQQRCHLTSACRELRRMDDASGGVMDLAPDQTMYPAIHRGNAEMKTYTFEGRDLVIQHDPGLGSSVSLADLCEIHQCGTPEDVLPLLQQCGGGCHEPCRLADFGGDPGVSLVNLTDHDLMGTIRALSVDWNLAFRFREWLVARVFHTSPHLEYESKS